jgi:hypothetical protein
MAMKTSLMILNWYSSVATPEREVRNPTAVSHDRRNRKILLVSSKQHTPGYFRHGKYRNPFPVFHRFTYGPSKPTETPHHVHSLFALGPKHPRFDATDRDEGKGASSYGRRWCRRRGRGFCATAIRAAAVWGKSRFGGSNQKLCISGTVPGARTAEGSQGISLCSRVSQSDDFSWSGPSQATVDGAVRTHQPQRELADVPLAYPSSF